MCGKMAPRGTVRSRDPSFVVMPQTRFIVAHVLLVFSVHDRITLIGEFYCMSEADDSCRLESTDQYIISYKQYQVMQYLDIYFHKTTL